MGLIKQIWIENLHASGVSRSIFPSQTPYTNTLSNGFVNRRVSTLCLTGWAFPPSQLTRSRSYERVHQACLSPFLRPCFRWVEVAHAAFILVISDGMSCSVRRMMQLPWCVLTVAQKTRASSLLLAFHYFSIYYWVISSLLNSDCPYFDRISINIISNINSRGNTQTQQHPHVKLYEVPSILCWGELLQVSV